MFYRKFSLRLEAGVLPPDDANFTVSSPFNKSDIIDDLIQRLIKIHYVPDLNSLNFIIKEDKLYMEGMAYEEQPPTEFNYEFM